ncbi:MAG: hypothetical protein B7Y25_01935 [Alphaproteobacteria bacterium 16-39-46]|nr:MAG: hypothetical protein B7Y25_01935 [Alphaproteobacteria bacterium 16-39-46]OZA43738.1 MAG: hypothetical protein B7X84_02185 [Alphaproteobacteria bacterium 17-39-52]HQS83554.1 nuclear transport factor 2 family protein [Alphaproteobacteria bacterium]HQS93347.1 nuclear transport factor 2 family protein [Alphaproteobacteria bacterium]
MKIRSQANARHVLLEFCKNYSERNLEKNLSLFSEKAHLWGTGVDENRVGLKEIEAQLKRDWSQSESGKLDLVSWVEPISETDLWAAAVCRATVVMGGIPHVFENLRGTIMVEKEEGDWKIVHMHASFPDARQPAGDSFPVSS